jgi:hypothetical protein
MRTNTRIAMSVKKMKNDTTFPVKMKSIDSPKITASTMIAGVVISVPEAEGRAASISFL